MAISARTANRLDNWKFGQALSSAEEDGLCTHGELDLIVALAKTFGDSGWFDGYLGHIVTAAVDGLTMKEQGRLDGTRSSALPVI